MVAPSRKKMLRVREIEHERIQSEIRRNDAEAKKMEAEANSFKRTKKDIVAQYFFSALVGGIIIVAFTLDTFKNLYEVTSYKIKENIAAQERLSCDNDKLKNEKKKLEGERVEFKRQQQRYEKKIAELSDLSELTRITQRRYLEALMRQASAEAYIGWRILKKREIYLRLTDRNASDAKAKGAFDEAFSMINDYWQLVVQMAEETRADMFPEVKQELAGWLQNREKTGGSIHQRKALDLIERHINQIRNGHSRLPDDLISSFLDQPEFQEPSNKETKN